MLELQQVGEGTDMHDREHLHTENTDEAGFVWIIRRAAAFTVTAVPAASAKMLLLLELNYGSFSACPLVVSLLMRVSRVTNPCDIY